MSDDTINGGSGNDTIFAGSGNDLVSGGDGDDIIFDGSGDDTINGDADNDTLWLTSGSNDGSDSLNGGSGTDTLIEDLSTETSGAFSVYLTLATGTHYLKETPGVGVDTLAGIENFGIVGDFALEAIGEGPKISQGSGQGTFLPLRPRSSRRRTAIAGSPVRR